ncbi:AAA family ATPase [Sphingomonas sp.]|uniref:AAA family ATPase n=1 Tax=Sphingomonas sp. TaxID=28214 RepID=UPI0017993A0D|nr:AAA family ATPase [Sphingomonas sp.]MBA3511599.1 AAA family ATPase [Sphingomonas sp.]
MSSPASQILAWSKSQQPWRQCALRRLITCSFTKSDEDELLTLLKADHGLVETSIKPVPLTEEHIPDATVTDALVALVEITGVQRVNQLSTQSELEFGTSGLTVIYGDNGSGKSGFVRILKSACRSKGADAVLPNVFAQALTTEPSRAKISYRMANEEKPRQAQWESGQATDEELSQVSVFDSKCASIYVDNFNELKAVPYSLDCFERLAALCDALKSRLELERSALAAATALPVVNLDEGTAAKSFLDALATKSKDQVEAFATHTEADEERLTELEKIVGDPQARLAELKLVLQSAYELDKLLNRLQRHLSPEGLQALHKAAANASAGHKAAELAAKQGADDGSLLPGVGSALWGILYEAAQRYSEQEAYPGKPFPVTDGAAQCVLCQQALDDAAKNRFVTFKSLVDDEASKAADAADKAFSAKLQELKEATEELSKIEVHVQAITKENAAVGGTLSQFVTDAKVCAVAIQSHFAGADLPEDFSFPPFPTARLDTFQTAGKLIKAEVESAIQADDTATTKSELSSLKAKKLLAENKAQVLARLGQLGSLKKLDKAIGACGTHGISQQGRQLLQQYVTKALNDVLTEERKALRMQHIPLSLLSEGKKGAERHKLKLKSESFTGQMSQVLSEGEHRAMALALFLAELRVLGTTTPVVVDDPVSSLDHIRAERVAARLVEEAKSRQAIVFTHDLFFYTTVQTQCAHQQVPLRRLAIIKTPISTGVIDPSGDPWAAKSVPQRVDWLNNKLSHAKKAFEAGNQEEFAGQSRDFYFGLRPTWERLVEELLLKSVVVRFRLSVETTRLAEVVVDDDLFLMVSNGMSETSALAAHDQAAIPNAPWPEPDEMEAHLRTLTGCIAAVDAKSKATKKVREALLKPPKVTTH